MSTTAFNATLAPVGGRQGVALRDSKRLPAFLAELVGFGSTAPAVIFGKRTDDPGETDIFTLIAPTLAPRGWRDDMHRRCGLLEALRVLAGFESSWKWDEGRDVKNTPAGASLDEIEAGAFQVSYNSRGFGVDLRELLAARGIRDAETFQERMKADHALALEYAARLLRHTIRHNGPAKRGEILPFLSVSAVAEFRQMLAA